MGSWLFSTIVWRERKIETKKRTQAVSPPCLQDTPVPVKQRLSLREALLLARYHACLLNWWLFLLMTLGFLAVGFLVWLQVRAGDLQSLSHANTLSQFVMEPGAGLLASMLACSLLVGDPLLEVLISTRTGISGIAFWRAGLTFGLLLLCSAVYLAWSLAHGISYARQQSSLFFFLLWFVPVLLMSMLSLFGSLLTRNAALGMVIAVVPLAGSLLLAPVLLPIQAAHPFLVSYTFSGGQDAPDWWINRLTLLGIAVVFAAWNWWLLRREERLVGNAH